MRTLLLLVCLTALVTATQYTAALTGNWDGDSTWGGGGHPVAGDTAVIDGSYNVTLTGNAACAKLDMTGSTATLALSTYDLVVSGNAITRRMTQAASSNVGFSVGGNWTTVGDTFTQTGAGKVILYGSMDISGSKVNWGTSCLLTLAATSSATLKCGSNVISFTRWDGVGGEWTLLDNWGQTGAAVTNTHVNGKVICNGYRYNEGSGCSLPSGFILEVGTGRLQASTGTVTIQSGALVTVSTGGQFNTQALNINSGGKVIFTGSPSMSVYGNVVIASDSFVCDSSTMLFQASKSLNCVAPIWNLTTNAYTVTAASDLKVKNALTISSGGTFNAGTYTTTIGGNFAKTGTFTAGTSTIEFYDSTKISTVSGSSTFNILSCTTSGKTVKFTSGTTQTVTSLVSNGEEGSLVTLTSSDGANAWTISDGAGTDSLNYTNLSWSTATGGAQFKAYTDWGNVDGGDNDGWLFEEPPPPPEFQGGAALFTGALGND